MYLHESSYKKKTFFSHISPKIFSINLIGLNMEKIKLWEELSKLYFNPAKPGSFASIKQLYLSAKQSKLPVTYKLIREYLASNNTYTLHRLTKTRYKRNKFEVYWRDYIWATDLIDTQSLSRWNRGISYIGLIIDLFDRHVWLLPLRNKKSQTVVAGYDAFFTMSKQRVPQMLQSDAGSEFISRAFSDMLQRHNIKHYYDSDEKFHCPHAERAIRSILALIHKYLHSTGSKTYIDVLQQLADNYNNRYHTALKTSPASITIWNQAKLRDSVWPDDAVKASRIVRFAFRLNDTVRVAKERGTFYKAYRPVNIEEVFRIARRIARPFPMYKLKTLKDQPISGSYNEKELTRVLLHP